MFTSVDIRKTGSGNIGASNVRRTAGTTLGALTLAGDILKGALPVCLAGVISGPDTSWREIYMSLVAFSAFSGHLFPAFLKFKGGGKGVATASGCFFVLAPMASVIVTFIFMVFIFAFNRVSVGSLAAATALPVAVWQTTHSRVLTGCAVITVIFIYYRHKDNIRRLLSGMEPVIWKRKNR
jgi:glycerol-3-phosphate acyltransferase PlsY